MSINTKTEKLVNEETSITISNNECKLEVFSNNEFGDINAIIIDGEFWFIGKEIADRLGYGNSRQAIITNVEEIDKQVFTKNSLNFQKSTKMTFEIPPRGLIFINESGLYSLILGSKLSSAKRFKHWITSEVLPSIRKNKAYIAERNENIYLKNKLDKIENLLESRLETQAKAIEAIKEDVALLFEPSEPNMKVVSTWKKTIVYPLIRMISDLTNKDESLCYKMVYSVMALHYGFCESSELARFERQYGTQYLSTINVIAIHPLFQERFVKAANEIVDKLKSKLIVSDMVVENVDNDNGDTEVIEESEAPVIKFTIQDDVEEIILKVAEFVGDNTKKQLATRRKIYSMITTNRGWKQALTRNRCDTKKDLVTLNHSYRKKFVKACNEIVGAA